MDAVRMTKEEELKKEGPSFSLSLDGRGIG
jgi:hypothetical protein